MKKVVPLLALSMIALVPLLSSCSSTSGTATTTTTTQSDRMALPAINTALIPTAQKDTFNQGDPSTDVTNFKTTATTSITSLRTAVNNVSGFPPEDSPGVSAATVAGVVIPDVFTVDLSKDITFPNGRKLTDDVIDPVLGLVLNRGNVLGGGSGVSDAVANDSTFLTSFPYLGTSNK